MDFGIYNFRIALFLLVTVMGCSVIDCFRAHPLSVRLRSHDVRKQRNVVAQSNGYETHNYTQVLDHFSFVSESRTFQQRYFLNKTFWGGPLNNSPIFVCMGEEDSLDDLVLAGGCGIVIENAPQFKALLLFVEHRYYGESQPDLIGDPLNPVVNTSTYGYLTSEQALADYATLIKDLKKNLSAENSPVIVFGGSYAGMLAAWLRLKYPHIILGALASSAPILLFPNVTPDYSFYAVVTKDFRDTNESCYTTIKNSWGEMDRLASQPGGLQNLSTIFNTCTNVTDVQALHDVLIYIYEQAAQYDYSEVIGICDAIDSAPEGTDILVRVSAGAQIVYPFCLPVVFADQFYPWSWQTCTEMVFPMAQNPNKTMFPLEIFDLKSYAEDCKRKYGVVPRPNWVTTEYGGHDIRKVLKHFGSNIIFSNGLRDPWSSGGVVENISESIVALPTKEGTHCLDLSPSLPSDPEWLKEQKSKEIEYIKSWIEQYNYQFHHK